MSIPTLEEVTEYVYRLRKNQKETCMSLDFQAWATKHGDWMLTPDADTMVRQARALTDERIAREKEQEP